MFICQKKVTPWSFYFFLASFRLSSKPQQHTAKSHRARKREREGHHSRGKKIIKKRIDQLHWQILTTATTATAMQLGKATAHATVRQVSSQPSKQTWVQKIRGENNIVRKLFKLPPSPQDLLIWWQHIKMIGEVEPLSVFKAYI